MLQNVCTCKVVASLGTIFGPGLVTAAAITILLIINSYNLHSIDSLFYGMLIAVTCVCALVLVYAIMALMCGGERATLDLIIALVIFCLIMVSFSGIFWAKRSQFRHMMELVWKDEDNKTMKNGFKKQFKCTEDDCEESFTDFVDKIGNIIATCLCVLSAVILIINLVTLILYFLHHQPISDDVDSQKLTNLVE